MRNLGAVLKYFIPDPVFGLCGFKDQVCLFSPAKSI